MPLWTQRNENKARNKRRRITVVFSWETLCLQVLWRSWWILQSHVWRIVHSSASVWRSQENQRTLVRITGRTQLRCLLSNHLLLPVIGIGPNLLLNLEHFFGSGKFRKQTDCMSFLCFSVSTQKHCVLVCNSPAYQLTSQESFNYAGLMPDQLVQKLVEVSP